MKDMQRMIDVDSTQVSIQDQINDGEFCTCDVDMKKVDTWLEVSLIPSAKVSDVNLTLSL